MGGESNNVKLYSLHLNSSILQIKVEIILSIDDQFSQLIVDCNGNIWFTQIFNGLYLYKPGWNDAYLLINEDFLNGFQIIRRENSIKMDWIIANYFAIRNYTSSGLQSNIYTTYPSPTSSDSNDIMHNLQWDYQNKKMCVYGKKNAGDYVFFCYDPYDNPEIVWNYVTGKFQRQELSLRFGQYVGGGNEETETEPTQSPTTFSVDNNVNKVSYSLFVLILNFFTIFYVLH